MFRAKYMTVIIIGSAIIVILVLSSFTGPAVSTGVTLTPKVYLPIIVKDLPPTHAGLPDLTIPRVTITYENPACYDGSPYGTGVWIQNIGLGDAGMFIVDNNIATITVNGLNASDQIRIWIPGQYQPPVVVDATDIVVERNEDNNMFNDLIPTPTPPLPCSFPIVTRSP